MADLDSRSMRENAAACAEAERVWLEGTSDPLTTARIEAHQQRCGRCQLARQRLVDLRADVTRAAPPLDDVTRARLLASLAPALDGIAATGARPSASLTATRRWPRVALAVTLVAAAAGGLLLMRSPSPRPEPAAPLVAQPVPAVPTAPPAQARPTALPAPDRSLALLHPRGRGQRHERTANTGARSTPGVARIELADGELHQAALGQQAQLGLRGPALLEVMAADSDSVDLRLVRGTLLVDYDRRRGGRLRIHSPGAVTEVVGTLFSVEVSGEQSRVAVVRGRVAVLAASRSHLLQPGQALLSDGSQPGRMPAPTRTLLRGFQRQVAMLSPASASAAQDRPAPPPGSFPPEAPSAAAPALAPSPAPLTPPPAPAAEPPLALAPPPVAPAAPVQPASPTPAARYRLAEAAMSRGALGEARGQLEALVAESGGDRMAAVARYELAQMALRAGDRPGAVRWLDELALASPPPALAESAHFLRCEAALGGGDPDDARRCLQRFRAQYPASANDPLALGLLFRLAPVAELCGPLAAALDQFLQRYPDHRFAAELTARRSSCGR